jgi:hypothetical protein
MLEVLYIRFRRCSSRSAVYGSIVDCWGEQMFKSAGNEQAEDRGQSSRFMGNLWGLWDRDLPTLAS